MSTDAKMLGLPDIAFTGYAGSGKSTAAQLLVDTLGYAKASFAQPLKTIATDIWGPAAQTDRDKLQKLGVAVREIEQDSWVNLLLRELPDHGENPVVIDDLRFENEWWALRAEGFTIIRLEATRASRIDRLKGNGKWQDERQLEHESETSVDHMAPDVVIENTGAKDELYKKLAAVLSQLRRKR